VGSLLLTETETTVGVGWRPGVTTASAGDDPVVMVSDGRRGARVGVGTPLRATLLELLGSPAGVPLEWLLTEAADAACQHDGALAEVEARSLLNRLARLGLLAVWLSDRQGVAATIATPVLPDEPLEPAGALALSPDVFLRRDGDDESDLVLESATDPARRDPIEARFAALLLTGELPLAWRTALRHAGILVAAGDGRPDPCVPAGRWEFHDRLFHTRSRRWRGAARPYGATMRLAGAIEPLPADHLPATAAGPRLALAVPETGWSGHPAYGEAAERRRSQRLPSAPLTARQLGELLHQTLRVRAVHPTSAGDELDRPVPSGGALGAVGVYPLVVDCEGLDPGLYHYDGTGHVLRKLEAARDSNLEPLVADARATAGLSADAPVQALLVLAARFGRLQYKYSGMAYAAVLKDVGVVYQAIYLAATAIGIGGCALGGGDALAFERASGLDRWEEGSVGEFLLTGVGANTGPKRGDAQ
jgi:SagB-type dehydrogenase family enzyme